MKFDREWIDGLSEGILLVDGESVEWLNSAACDLLGVERQRALGEPLISVLRDHRLERVALEGGNVELVVRGRRLAARGITGGIALLDVTEARLGRERERELLAVLSHELRTPATTISSVLEALRAGIDGERRERFLDHAQAEVARLVRLIEDLTVESSPPRERRLELGKSVERAANILETTFGRRGVTLEWDVPDAIVWADEDKLLQVLLNLLENAALHGPADSEVRVLAERDGEFVTVTVADPGAGPTAAERNGLFEPRARARPGSGKGSGLGLYIVKTLVERWGGRVWNETGAQGNRFRFTVPVRARSRVHGGR